MNRKFIEDSIKNNDIVVFMKGTKKFPTCGFSALVVQIFKNLNIDFKDINVLENDELRQEIKIYSNWPTIPQIYINGVFIGGSDILKELYTSGELIKIIND